MTDALKNFEDALSGTVAEFGQPGYDNALWAENATKCPKYVVSVLNAEDIAKAIKFARSEGLTVAIRGGGHSTSGASSIEGGLLINMRRMNRIRVDKGSMTVHVEGGCRSHEIELETMKHGMSTAVGTCSEVGIVGYATLGGVGFSTGKYGLGVDNIVSAKVVLADGQIVEASETSHPDLYWGIRGGGSNFGVIAELGMRLHEQRQDVYTIQYAFVIAQLPAIFNVLEKWLAAQRPSEACMLFMSLGPDGNPYVTVLGYSDTDQADGESSFCDFLDIGPVHTIHGQVDYTYFGTMADFMNAIKGNKLTTGAYVDKMTLEGLLRTWDTWIDIVDQAPASSIMYEFYPYASQMAKVPAEATAFSQRKTDTIVLASIGWTDESFTNSATSAALILKAAISSTSSEAAQAAISYANYGDIWAGMNETDEYARKLFGPNYPRLQEVKKKYDPEQVFNRWFAIRPAA